MGSKAMCRRRYFCNYEGLCYFLFFVFVNIFLLMLAFAIISLIMCCIRKKKRVISFIDFIADVV